MTDTYINTTVETSVSDAAAFDMTGDNDVLFLGTAGSLIAFGDAGNGLDMSGANETAVLDGTIFSAAGVGVSETGSGGSNITVNGEIDGATGIGIYADSTADVILVNGSVYGGMDGILLAGTDISLSVDGSVKGANVGIYAQGNGQVIHVNGFVGGYIGGGAGIDMVAQNQTVDIGTKGDIYGPLAGILVLGSGQNITNDGRISGPGGGLYTDDHASGLTFVNDGVVNSILMQISTNMSIQNAGLISSEAGTVAIDLVDATTGISVENSGIVHGNLDVDSSSTVTIQNSGSWNGQLDIESSGNSVGNAGKVTNGIIFGSANDLTSGNSVANDGTIHGGVTFLAESGAVASDTVSNSGTIYGGVTFNAAAGAPDNDTLTNSGTIYGGVDMGANETLRNTGTIHGNVTFVTLSNSQSFDVFDNSNGIVIGSISGGSSNDTFIIGSGSNTYNPGGTGDHFDFGATFGNDIINGFKTGTGHDVIAFSGGDFTSFAELQTHMTQVGSTTVITLEAGSTIELTHTTIAHLVAADFVFG